MKVLNNSHFYCIVSFFHVICWTSTIALVSYWIYAYTLNEDLCLVDYKKYLETDFDKFPVLSICLKDQISKEKLELQNPKIDIETYIDFLSGNIYEKELAKINYENVTNDISKYVTASRVYWRNGTKDNTSQRQVLRTGYAFVHQRGGLYQCYELQTPKVKDFKIMIFTIKSDALPPRNRSQNYEMQTY